jgi:hypothetical protein
MKKTASIFVILSFALLFIVKPIKVEAQQYKLIQQEKIAFFTKRLGLTPDEAKLFWPIYDEYQKQKEQVLKERKATEKYYITNVESLSSSELEKITDRYVGFHKRESELLEQYTLEFKKILPIEKVLKIYVTEVEFRRHLIQMVRDRKVGQGLRDNR